MTVPDGFVRLRVAMSPKEFWEAGVSCDTVWCPHEWHGTDEHRHMCVTVPKAHAQPLLHCGYVMCTDADDT
jgi:hypothetical protein